MLRIGAKPVKKDEPKEPVKEPEIKGPKGPDAKEVKPKVEPEPKEPAKKKPAPPLVVEVDEGKIHQDMAHYLEPGSVCSGCSHFLADDGCDVVQGIINPDGVCMLWWPKELTDKQTDASLERAEELEPEESVDSPDDSDDEEVAE